jgi:hypothetical protein
MRNLRPYVGALIALVFAAMTGAAAAQNVKYFTLTEVTLTGDTVSAKFSNIDAGNSSFNAISLKAITSGGSLTFVDPPVVTVTPPGTGSPPNPLVADAGTKLIVSDLSPVKKTKNVVVTAKVSSTVGSGGCMVIEWQGSAWTGSVSSPSVVFQQQNPNPTTVIGTGCKLSLVPPSSLLRTSAGTSASFAVTVYVTDSSNVPVPGIAIPFTLSGSAGCSFTSNPTGTTGTALGSLVANLGSTATSCTLTATTTSPALSDSKSVPVFDGVLGCTSTVFDALNLPAADGAAGAFDASEGGATDPGDTGFIAGVRGSDPDKGVCKTGTADVKVNYEVVNNIPTGGSTQSDPLGNTVYVGTYSITWDPNQTDANGNLLKPVFAVIATMRPEWGAAATGLPTHKTLICTASPCSTTPLDTSGNINTGWKVAVACLSSLVKHSSLPFTDSSETTREKGCVASERWDVVATTECSGSPPSGAIPAAGRCLKPTAILIMGDDPVFGR